MQVFGWLWLIGIPVAFYGWWRLLLKPEIANPHSPFNDEDFGSFVLGFSIFAAAIFSCLWPLVVILCAIAALMVLVLTMTGVAIRRASSRSSRTGSSCDKDSVAKRNQEAL